MPSPSRSTGALPLVPFSIASVIPSPSESRSYGFGLASPSVFGGVTPPLDDCGIPLASTLPSTLPSPLVSVPFDSLASEIPSLSESGSNRFGIPSPSVSQSTDAGLQIPFSTVSRIPSLSSSKSISSVIPSPSESGGQPFKIAVPTTYGHWSFTSKTPSLSESVSL